MRRAYSNRLVYGAIVGMNLAVGLMFTAVLFPHPPSVEYQPLVSAVAVKRLAPLKIREVTVGEPSRVIVPDVGIDIGVQPGTYTPESQTWTIGYGSAYHADRSVPVNDSNGTTLLYGHADRSVFGRVIELQKGSTAQVETEVGAVFFYEFESSEEVKPTDTGVLNSTGPPRLVLQTCSGPFDVYRTLVTFKLVGVQKT